MRPQRLPLLSKGSRKILKIKKVKIQNFLTHQGEVPLFYFEILDLLSNFMFSLLENFTEMHLFVNDKVLRN